MSKAIVAVPRSNANAGQPDHRPARHLKQPPNRRAATIKLTRDLLRDNRKATIIPTPRHQASHADCRCLLIQFVAQGTLGYVQYAAGVPEAMVAAHVLGSVLVWVAALRFHLALTQPVPAASEAPAVTAAVAAAPS